MSVLNAEESIEMESFHLPTYSRGVLYILYLQSVKEATLPRQRDVTYQDLAK